jgi:hypothetical protein
MMLTRPVRFASSFVALFWIAACSTEGGAGGSGGGTGSGGSASTGGVSTGGVSTGGGSGGGSVATGGRASGGAASGGTSSGGTTGGNVGVGGNEGLGGAGDGGGVGTFDYTPCDRDLGTEDNPACADGSICRSNYCTVPCENDILEDTFGTGDDCPLPTTGNASRTCGLGYCALRCTEEETCPDGLACYGYNTCENLEAAP